LNMKSSKEHKNKLLDDLVKDKIITIKDTYHKQRFTFNGTL